MDNLFILGNETEWCELSLKQLCKKYNAKMINEKLPIPNKILKVIARIHFSQTVNKRVKLPCKKIWYKTLFNQLHFIKDECGRTCLLIFDHNTLGGDEGFLRYVRRRVPNIFLVYIFTNFVKGSAALSKGYVTKLNDMYDFVFAFDPIDTDKYGFLYSPLIYDADPSLTQTRINEERAFYVGQAKDRLPTLISIFEQLKALGIETDFNIVNVPQKDVVHDDEIRFNQPMSYKDVLQHISQATCLIDGIQGGSTGLTIKTCEAVCYNKKLITTNKHVMEYPFYDPRFILVIDEGKNIDKSFFLSNREVQYPKESSYFFSGERFWNQLWQEIDKLPSL